MNIKKIAFILILLCISVLQVSLIAEGDGKNKSNTLNKVNGAPVRSYLDINNIFTVFKYDGISDIDINEANSGFVFPKGSGKTAVFQSGFLWGAMVPGDPQPRVGGTAYRTGLVPGRITNSGLPVAQLIGENPDADDVRIFRVRPDVYPGGPNVDLTQDATLEASNSSALRLQYEADWTEWPAHKGAPYFDGNANNQYDPDPGSGDIPGFPGASQTIWFVANDLNVDQARYPYGADPLGIEMQATIWAYSQSNPLGNMYFRKYKIINKSDTPFNDMYVSMFSDVDLGNASDDLAGCDTLLSLGYCYNANANDPTYSPLPPPAVGFDFLQGPIVNGEYLPMTAFYYFARDNAAVVDPTQGDIQGSTQFYNFFQGKIGLTGEPFTDPTGQPTPFALYGDPQLNTGWLDGQLLPAGDRRIGSASGPFTMLPGDEQEIVVAEIVAGAIPGVDRLFAIGLLKYFDDFAQLSYDNDFKLLPAPSMPEVNVIELPNQINLDWGENLEKVNSTENFNTLFGGERYKFQGYNVYQLPSASATKETAKRIATFDINDDFQVVLGKVYDPNTGQILLLPEQLGTNNGISRYLEITTDQLNGGTPLINGIRYYFAVTAYGVMESYDKNTPIDSFATISNVENPLVVFTVVPRTPNPGEIYVPAGNFTEINHVGTADGGLTLNIVDPLKLTGNEYQVYFTQRQEIRDPDGYWIPASEVTRNYSPNDPDTLTGSSIDAAAVYGPQTGTIELRFSLDLVSPDDDFADGITLTFPSGVTVLEAPIFESGNGLIAPKIIGNVVNMGNINHEYTENGPFAGGEEWSIIVQGTLPISIDWIIYDDGYGGAPVDATGSTTVENIGNASRLAKYWNLKNVTTNAVKLENQSIVGGVDLFPDRSDIPVLNVNSTHLVDGVLPSVDVVYEAPINFSSDRLVLTPDDSPTTLSSSSNTSNLDIQNYTIFGGTISSFAADNFGFGTYSIDELQQDYELRFTGLWDTTVVNGQTLITVREGTGSMATIFSTVSGAAGLATHPLNPNPGTAAPFLVRVPFEVWNKDTQTQVNLMFRDREQEVTANPFFAWDLNNRMYAVLVNSPYNETTPLTGALRDPATWVLVFYGTNYTPGDVVTISYDNPIQIGIDSYTYTPTASSYSQQNAVNEVGKINVFPNPYYGVNSEELNKYNRFVTFSHLPAKATIRIFNLAGVLVKTIHKDDAGQFQRWDLANESGLPVASGLYLAYIDLPDLGQTKILKVAIIQEQQILDRF